MNKPELKIQAARKLWVSSTVNKLVDKMCVRLIGRPWGEPPTLLEVQEFMATLWPGARRYANEFYTTMEHQHWHERDRQDGQRIPIRDWRAAARAFASTMERRRR